MLKRSSDRRKMRHDHRWYYPGHFYIKDFKAQKIIRNFCRKIDEFELI